MLRFPVVIILVFTLCWTVAGQANKEISEVDAAKAFSQGNYSIALSIWNRLYESGNTDPNLLYNIGNAYTMLDSTPYAILSFEKALRFKPGSSEIQTALKNERNRMPETVTPLSQFVLFRWAKEFLLLFRPGAWAIMGLLLLIVAMISWFYSLQLIKGKLFLSQYNPFIFIFSGVIFLLIAFLAYGQIYKTDEAIIFSQCESRQGPSAQSPLVRTLYPGEKVILRDTINDWYKVNLLNLDEAWIRKECAVVIDLHAR